ncbi:MAG: hypothetical protein KJO18_05865 [Acidimicrobiia bacterium]|nr:hypothetical protein [Acidimicrobiia bacterium]
MDEAWWNSVDLCEDGEEEALWFAERARQRGRRRAIAAIVIVAMLVVYVLSNVITQWGPTPPDDAPPITVIQALEER